MKVQPGKYIYFIALVLALSISTASAQQQRQGTQLQTRQLLRDQSNMGTVQQQQRIRSLNQSRYENNAGQGQKSRLNKRQGNRQGKSKGDGGSVNG